MAMVTRFRTKQKEENTDILKPSKLAESKVTLKTILGPDDKRKAFGEIHNRRDVTSIDNQKFGLEKDKKGGISGVIYKDIKPRVDTRWKKEQPVAQKPTLKQTVSVPNQQQKFPLMRQSSKSNDFVKKDKTVKSITETITMQIKKTTTIASAIDLKKEQKSKGPQKFYLNTLKEAPLIHSPQSLKIKREKIVEPGRKYFDSHSTHLINQIEKIDANDKGNPQLLSEYVNDIYAYLMKIENLFLIRNNHLETQMDVTPKMRSVLLDWLNEVHCQFNLEIETFHMAVSMIDRYLQACSSTPRRYLQLVGVTALFMASKYEELMPPEITDFVYVTDDTYSKEQILQMEMKIFKALEFNLSKPLPIHFLRRFAKAAGSQGERQYIAAKYFLELASIDYEMTKYKPSEIAAASLYLSLYIMNKIKSDNAIWTPTLQYYSTYKVEDLMPIVKRLAVIVSTAQEVKLKSVCNKYSHAHFKFISTLPEMTGAKIRELARNVL